MNEMFALQFTSEICALFNRSESCSVQVQSVTWCDVSVFLHGCEVCSTDSSEIDSDIMAINATISEE